MGEKFSRGAAQKDATSSPSATSDSPQSRALNGVRHTLKRSEILRGRNNFQLVFRHGRKIQGKYLRCLILSDDRMKLPAGSGPVAGFTVPGALKRAVDRNRLKRLTREAYRLNKEILCSKLEGSSKPLAMVFLYSSTVAGASRFPAFAEIELDMRNILQSLADTRTGEAG
jgi:ribonuclease P protein component